MHIKPPETKIQQSRSSLLKNTKFSESSRVWPFAPKTWLDFFIIILFLFSFCIHLFTFTVLKGWGGVHLFWASCQILGSIQDTQAMAKERIFLIPKHPSLLHINESTICLLLKCASWILHGSNTEYISKLFKYHLYGTAHFKSKHTSLLSHGRNLAYKKSLNRKFWAAGKKILYTCRNGVSSYNVCDTELQQWLKLLLSDTDCFR